MVKIFAALFLVTLSGQALAVGSIIVAAVVSSAFAATAAGMAIAMAINMVVAAVISKAFFSPNQPGGGGEFGSGSSPNPGNRQQVPPGTDNKLPVVYGTAFVGGTITDLSISGNNQVLYYVLSLCEVTNTNPGQTPDNITFGRCYFGGKLVQFSGDGYTVEALLDESTGVLDRTVAGKIAFYFYKNGSYSQVNQPLNAVQVLQASNLVYQWDDNKKMSNCAFVIIRLNYSQTANIRGIEQTKFEITNSRTAPGDCFLDYFTNTRYGAALPLSQVNTESLAALNAYSNQEFTYYTYTGTVATQPRFTFNGTVDTARSIMDNIQDMSSCCDCLVQYNEIQAKWGVIVQRPDVTPVMDINDSNMISAIQITPMDMAASYNVVECKFPDNSNQDAFNSSTFDLNQIAPQLMYPNEPVNKISLSLPLCNNDVQAQYIANRVLESAREDIQLQVSVNFVGLQLDAGDVVTVTNQNYGWVAKLFRINKITQSFNADGAVAVSLSMTEFNPQVYDDRPITQFTPAPNTGIGAPDFFGTTYPVTISNYQRYAPVPSFDVIVNTSQSGIIQYAEIWYSAFEFPTDTQRIFAGITAAQSNGNPYNPLSALPATTLTNIPFGNWYFFSRMVNSLSMSDYSPASLVVNWRPMTYQYEKRFLSVAYADDDQGDGFDLSPRGKLYFGLASTDVGNVITDPSQYTWYLADPPFSPLLRGTLTVTQLATLQAANDNFILFTNRSNRKISLSIGNAIYFGLGGAFVPSETDLYDQTVWSGLPDGTNIIDLDARTGQLTKFGTSSVSQADGLLAVSNNTSGAMVVSLQKFLNFGGGVYSKTFTTSSLTVDVYGRVVGFTDQDLFFFSEYTYTATAGQTVFACAHPGGQILVFRNGALQAVDEYTETDAEITLVNPTADGEIIYIQAMKAVPSTNYYAPMNITVADRIDDHTFTYIGLPFQFFQLNTYITFDNLGTPTNYTVTAADYVTKTVTVTEVLPPLNALVGSTVYDTREASLPYQVFSRVAVETTNTNQFQSNLFYVRNGFEQTYVNGAQINEIDYNLNQNIYNGFPSPVTGLFDIVLFTANNFGIPCSNITNSVTYTVAGQSIYPFSSNPLSMEIYANGVNLVEGFGYDYISDSIAYQLVVPYDNNVTLLNQQTYARDGAVI